MRTHCPHGVYIPHDICLTCLTPLGDKGELFLCAHCGKSGSIRWADDHLAECEHMTDEETLVDDTTDPRRCPKCNAPLVMPDPWDDFDPHCSLAVTVPWICDRIAELRSENGKLRLRLRMLLRAESMHNRAIRKAKELLDQLDDDEFQHPPVQQPLEGEQGEAE